MSLDGREGRGPEERDGKCCVCAEWPGAALRLSGRWAGSSWPPWTLGTIKLGVWSVLGEGGPAAP